MGRKMSDVKIDLMKDEEFRNAFVGLEDELALAGLLIEARMKAQYSGLYEVAPQKSSLTLCAEDGVTYGDVKH